MRKLKLAALVLFFPLMLMAAEDASTESETKTLIWPDGTRYVGGVKDGKRTGKGTVFWQNGTRFIGEFKDDMRNGPGTMTLPDGTVYSGFFENDKLVDSKIDSTLSATDYAASGANSATGETRPTQTSGETTLVPQGTAPQGTAPLAASNESSTAQQEQLAVTAAPTETIFNDQITSLSETVKGELRETIDLWGAAWSDKNVPQYLSNYSESFRVPGNLSRREWERLRRSRLNRPRYISVDVAYGKFEFVESNVIDVYFEQSYRSNTFSDVTNKVLHLRKEDHTWKILAENSR
jgi:hypothetical protein